MNNAGGNEEPEIVLSGALVRRRITEHLFIMLPVLFPECNPCGEGKSPDIPGHRGFPDGVHPAGGQDGGGEIRRFPGIERMLFCITEEQNITEAA